MVSSLPVPFVVLVASGAASVLASGAVVCGCVSEVTPSMRVCHALTVCASTGAVGDCSSAIAMIVYGRVRENERANRQK